MTDALKASVENTARFAGGSYLTMRFADVIDPKPEETRSSEEIISDIKSRLAALRGEKE